MMRKKLTSLLFVCLFASISITAQTAKPSSILTNLLDLPAPPAVIPVKEKPAEKARPEEFYNEKNIPPDDAPIEDLLDYWRGKGQIFDEFRYNIKPSEKSVERIFDAIKDNPEELPNFLNLLPATPEVIVFVKDFYQKEQQNDSSKYRNYPNYNPMSTKYWLRHNSDMFLDELLQSAKRIKINNRSIEYQADFEALARVSWDSAKPFIDTFEANRASIETYTLAKLVLYRHALQEKNLSDAESYREELKKLVEDKSLSHKARDLAMDALVLGGDFDGRTEWYMSLLNDETLLELEKNGFTGLTTLPRHLPNKREEWLPMMTKLIENGTPSERKAAISNLMLLISKDDKDALKILLPWLTDKNWVKDSDREREQFVNLLNNIQIPEAIPGLISIISNEEGFIRAIAASAAASNGAAQAIPVLRALIRSEEADDNIEFFVRALIVLKGFSIEEQVGALEALAAFRAKTAENPQKNSYDYSEIPLSPEAFIGVCITQIEEPEDMLVIRVIERIKTLRKTNPALAAELSKILQKWNSRPVFIEMLDQVKTGKSDVTTVLTLLARRAELREKIPSEISAMRTIDGLPRGLSAVVAEDQPEVFNILKRGDADTQIAALAAARLIRMKIPVGDVAPLLSDSNKTLALAAERYLEAEDSLEARNVILSKFADEARILGARTMFNPVEGKISEAFHDPLSKLFSSVNAARFIPIEDSEFNKFEKNLREEIKQNPDLNAVFALAENKNFGQAVIRLFKDKIVFTTYTDRARYYERQLSAKEYGEFYQFLLDSRLDTFQPTGSTCSECSSGEFLMFGRGGGRRVFVQATYSQKFPPFDKLVEFFESFAKGDLKLHYKLSEKLKGLEVLLADDKFTARSIWKNGEDFRVLVEDNEKKKLIDEELEKLAKADEDLDNPDENSYEKNMARRAEAGYKHFSWRKIENGKITTIETAQPNEIFFLGNKTDRKDSYRTNSTPEVWNRRADGFEFTTGNYEERKLFKIARSGAETIIKQGNYLTPVVSSDGKWLIAEKDLGEDQGSKLVRINLQNGNEFVVNSIPPADSISVLTFVNSQYKFLVGRAKFPYSREKDNPSPKTPEYYLLDPNTGAAQITKSDFQPLLDQTYRGLQPTNNPSEYWAARFNDEMKFTEIGRFNDKTAMFKTVLQLPDISLDSMDIWIDEKDSKIYFVYEGHLLSIPLTQQ